MLTRYLIVCCSSVKKVMFKCCSIIKYVLYSDYVVQVLFNMEPSMITSEQMTRADELLREGLPPEKVATEIGLETRSQLTYQLLRVGKRIRTIRVIENVPTPASA